MASVDDKLNQIISMLGTSSNAAVLAAITGVQNSVNAVIADIVPTPSLVPTVTAISPANGSITGGTTVVVTGTNFTGATGVQFGLVAGNSLVVTSDTSLTIISPAQPAGVVDIQIVDAAGTSATSPADQYTYA